MCIKGQCYLFAKSSFFRGYPPQHVVTAHYLPLKSQPGVQFPVGQPESRYYEFFDWNDPLAERIWKPFEKDGTHIEPLPEGDSVEADLDDPEIQRRQQEAQELFAYYAEQDMDEPQVGSDNYDDPADNFMMLACNAFQPDAFSKAIGRQIEEFLNLIGKKDEPEAATTYNIDVSTLNVQMLAKRPKKELRAINPESFDIANKIHGKLTQGQNFKNALQFTHHLYKTNDVLHEKVGSIRSLQNAMSLLPDNTVIDQDDDDFDKFVHHYYPSLKGSINTILTNYSIDSTNAKGLREELEQLLKEPSLNYNYRHLKEKLKQQAPPSPEYRPVSPSFDPDDFELIDADGEGSRSTTKRAASTAVESTKVKKRTEPPDDGAAITEENFKSSTVALLSYIYMRNFKFSPKEEIFFLFRISRKFDFAKAFRKKQKVVFFETQHKKKLWEDMLELVARIHKMKKGDLLKK